jgi:hypothetical protein
MSDSTSYLPEVRRFDDQLRLSQVKADSLTLIEAAEVGIAVDIATKDAVRRVLTAQSATYEAWPVREDFEKVVSKFTSMGGKADDTKDRGSSNFVDEFIADLRGDADLTVADAAARQRLLDLHKRVDRSSAAGEKPVSEKDRDLFGGVTQARKTGKALDMSLATVASLAADLKAVDTPEEAEDLRYKLWYLLDKQQQRFGSVTEVVEWQDQFLDSVQFRQDARTTATLFSLASAIIDPNTGASIVSDIEQRFAPNVRQLRKLAKFDTNLVPPELHTERDEFLDIQFEVIIDRLDKIVSSGRLDGTSELVVQQGLQELIEKVEAQTIQQKLGRLALSLSGLVQIDLD